MASYHVKPGSPGDILEHHGVKGMRWGVRKEEETSGRALAPVALTNRKVSNGVKETDRTTRERRIVRPGTPEFQRRIGIATRDRPQVVGGQQGSSPKQHGLTRNQKMLIAFGAASAAAAGYYAYSKYTGKPMPGLDLSKFKQEGRVIEGIKLPAHWDVSGLKNGPISKQKLGDLAGGEINAQFLDPDNIVISTTRGYADILPKDGFSNPFAAEQHASVTRVLEEMRNKYPAIRNMNIEVMPRSMVPGGETSEAFMSVMSMRAGEARIFYSDVKTAPSVATIQANKDFLPGLGHKDYLAYHEMGHLLAAAHGELPPAFDLIRSDAKSSVVKKFVKAQPLLHKEMFAKHGFTFEELSKLSEYGATQPAEAMAELFGHFAHPQMNLRLTPDQYTRAKAMFDEMGGLT